MPLTEQAFKVEKRKVITISFWRWTRFLLVPVFPAIILQIFSQSDGRALGFIYLFCAIGLYALIYRIRRLQFDSKFFYIVRGKTEKAIPLSAIISIKRSRTKVNGSRFWKLRYSEGNGKERLVRFFSDFDNEFHTSVRKTNPDVVIWHHPYFHD